MGDAVGLVDNRAVPVLLSQRQSLSRKIQLTEFDQACLAGAEGTAAQFAMSLIVETARVSAARELLDISQAHLVGCYDSGAANLKLLDQLLAQGARVRVPTTLNASSACVDVDSPSATDDICRAREVIQRYQDMGCTPALTCAPYHLPGAPGKGERIAWAESNAVVYANSVIGAHTNKTMQYLDVCAAITGRIPASGLYLEENRQAGLHLDCSGLSARCWDDALVYQLLGLFIGSRAQSAVPVLTGIPTNASDDELRALGAAAASSGNLAMFHAVGLTPEAPDLETALGGQEAGQTLEVKDDDLDTIASRYGAEPGSTISAICLGTPHFSYREFELLLQALQRQQGNCVIPVYVTTSRYIRRELESKLLLADLLTRGVQVITDSCSYYGRVVPDLRGTVMTNSAKWAYYSTGNLGISSCLASLSDCVATATSGLATHTGERG
jgi:predicted aconitase